MSLIIMSRDMRVSMSHGCAYPDDNTVTKKAPYIPPRRTAVRLYTNNIYLNNMGNNTYDKFQNKYRIPSNRWNKWNYAAYGHYFITIVTHNHHHLFGKITDGKMVLNAFGQIIHNVFIQSFEIRPQQELCEYVIMPNHIHAIIYLHPVETHCCASPMDIRCVETHCCASPDDNTVNKPTIHPSETHSSASLHRKPKSISSFVSGFKSTSVKTINNYIDTNNIQIPKYNKNNPMWQTNYYDHIIRDSNEYNSIAEYIISNPMKWEEDEYGEYRNTTYIAEQ